MGSLQFPGGLHALTKPTTADLEASARDWFWAAKQAFDVAAEKMSAGAIDDAIGSMAHVERCLEHARLAILESKELGK